MKIITNIGYHGTGSGALDDFFREFDNIPCAPSEYECRFLQDPDGISDLEYNLIDNPNRLNSGFALKRYLLFCKNNNRMYKKIFGKKKLFSQKILLAFYFCCKSCFYTDYIAVVTE